MMRTVTLAGLISTFVLTGVSSAGDSTTRTTLPEVIGCPETFTKMPFDVDLLYAGVSDVFNPFYSVFEPSSYVNFRAWGTSSPIWTREGYASPHYLFYINRRSDRTMHEVLAMKPMTWFRARCQVRSTFNGRAWIEVLDVVDQGREMSREDLMHMARGWVHNERGEYHRAVLEFDEVSYKGMPEPFEARLLVERGKAHLGSGDAEKAVSYFRQARAADSTYGVAHQLYAQAEAYRTALHRGEIAMNPLFKPAPVEKPAAPETDEADANAEAMDNVWPDESTPSIEVTPADATPAAPVSTEPKAKTPAPAATANPAPSQPAPAQPAAPATAPAPAPTGTAAPAEAPAQPESATANGTETEVESSEAWPEAVEISTEWPEEEGAEAEATPPADAQPTPAAPAQAKPAQPTPAAPAKVDAQPVKPAPAPAGEAKPQPAKDAPAPATPAVKPEATPPTPPAGDDGAKADDGATEEQAEVVVEVLDPAADEAPAADDATGATPAADDAGGEQPAPAAHEDKQEDNT